MASPFSVFRKNQKILMATFGVAAMIAFVFLGPLSQYMGGGREHANNPVVVETKFGNLKDSELDALEYQRQLVERFIQDLVVQAAAKQFNQPGMDNRWLQPIAQQQFMMWRNRLMTRSGGGPEEQAVETMLMAERAKQMGLVVTDQTINDIIRQISSDNLPPAEIQAIIRRLQPQRPVSVGRLFDALRTELLAMQYYQFFISSLTDVPPAQRFDYYSRLNRQAKTELMPLAVVDFVNQVSDPSDAELKEYYEKYKNTYPDPTSPEPGFKKPKRASFQYFKGSLDSLTETLKDDVTDEEIAKYYEENKQQFPASGLNAPSTAAPAAETPAEAATPEPAAEEPAAETPEEKPASDAPSETPAETPSAEEPATEQPPVEEAPASEQPAEDTPPATEEKPAEEASSDSPQARREAPRGVFRLASYQDENAPEETPAEEQPATEAPAQETPAEEKSAESKPQDPGDEIVPEPAVPDAPQFRPLDEVKDEIRRILAQEKAADRLRPQFEDLSGQMKRYADEFDIYSVEKQTDPKAQAPRPLDFSKLTEGKDLEAGELKSATPLQAAKSEIGQAFRQIAGSVQGQIQNLPFVQFAFADRLPEYRAEVVQDGENNHYLFWKTTEEPAYVPPLDEIRDEVVAAWKLNKARDIAQKRAEEYAQQARTHKAPLAELFGSQPNTKVLEPASFSWLTLGNVPMQPGVEPRLSEVDGVDQAGPDFMQTVFGLPAGGLGVAFNQPRDIVYVIRAIEFDPSDEQLREGFARENPSRYLSAGMNDQRAIYRHWIDELKTQADVRWLRQADVRRTAAEEGEF